LDFVGLILARAKTPTTNTCQTIVTCLVFFFLMMILFCLFALQGTTMHVFAHWHRILACVALLCAQSLGVELFVSYSEGDDANSGSQELPLKTPGAVTDKLSTTEQNLVLFRRGDVWPDNEGRIVIQGLSGGTEQNPSVFSAYGSGPRPKFINSGEGQALSILKRGSVYTKFVTVKNLHFTTNAPRNDHSTADLWGINCQSGSHHINFEDLVVENHGGGAVNYCDYTTIQRSWFSNNHRVGSASGSHSQGLFCSARHVRVADSVFHHNGKYNSYYDHQFYLSSCEDVVIERNTVTFASRANQSQHKQAVL
jgi:hypothetical protein